MKTNKKQFAKVQCNDKNKKLIYKKDNMVIVKKGINKLSFGEKHELMQCSAKSGDRKKIRKVE